MALQDQETRQRLLETAARLFAARGFNHVTVREICHEARANVAAVNYHFRDKLGLYTDVVNMAIEAMRSGQEQAEQAGVGRTPEQRLRAYIGVYLHRLVGEGRGSWIHQLLSREMSDPTPALDLVIQQVIRPRLEYLARLIAELTACDVADERVARAVASIQGQCLLYSRNPVVERLVPRWPPSDREIGAIADHIAAFSLAGIRALAPAATPGRHAARGRA